MKSHWKVISNKLTFCPIGAQGLISEQEGRTFVRMGEILHYSLWCGKVCLGVYHYQFYPCYI